MSIATQFVEDESAVQNTRTRQEWARIINAEWLLADEKATEAVSHGRQTGRYLITAKAQIQHGEFLKMVKRDFPFGRQKAQILMIIASTPHLANSTAPDHLPSAWVTLYQLSRLDKKDFDDAQKKGLVNSKTTDRAAQAIVGAYNIPEGETWGEGKSPAKLPTPSQAREIARETKRLVSASDGNIYSGATEEEGQDHARRRDQTYGIVDAVTALADCPVDAAAWIGQAETYWLQSFNPSSIDGAIKFLGALGPVLKEKKGIIDAQ